MRRLWPSSLAGRTTVILLLGLGLFHLFSIWVYEFGVEARLVSSREQHLAESMVAARRALAELPATERDSAAHALSTSTIEVHWGQRSLVNLDAAEDEFSSRLRKRLAGFMPGLDISTLRLGVAADLVTNSPNDAGAPHLLYASLQLADGSFVNFAAPLISPSGFDQHGTVASTTAMALGVLVVSILLVRSLTAPLRRLADAADRLGASAPDIVVPEEGAAEVRHAARAFNRMQHRIRDLIKDRTQTLAAISHDLRTPLTRLRLRAEFVDDEALRQKMFDDMAEMEEMLESTLDFLRVETMGGEIRIVDLDAILKTICDDHADAGDTVLLVGRRGAQVAAKPLALKRALSNLIGNAVKYGKRAVISIGETDAIWLVHIGDEGPGIPDAELERVFDPFVRLEDSRNRGTGGVGLGLTVSRSLLRGFGGDVTLENQPRAGLKATVTLPKASRI